MCADDRSLASESLSVSVRLLSVTAGVAMAAVFVVAGLLNPDPRGFGTHQQLGLPPCMFQTLTGINCPQCGMTTSFVHLVRGDLKASIRANPTGIVLALVFVLLAPWCVLSGILGRWLLPATPLKWLLFLGIAVLSLNVLLWLTRVLEMLF